MHPDLASCLARHPDLRLEDLHRLLCCRPLPLLPAGAGAGVGESEVPDEEGKERRGHGGREEVRGEQQQGAGRGAGRGAGHAAEHDIGPRGRLAQPDRARYVREAETTVAPAFLPVGRDQLRVVRPRALGTDAAGEDGGAHVLGRGGQAQVPVPVLPCCLPCQRTWAGAGDCVRGRGGEGQDAGGFSPPILPLRPFHPPRRLQGLVGPHVLLLHHVQRHGLEHRRYRLHRALPDFSSWPRHGLLHGSWSSLSGCRASRLRLHGAATVAPARLLPPHSLGDRELLPTRAVEGEA
mmetsp:Transcript_10037/g.33443  ORF Transcript_10037/g.33443 Transcript_10037/m.33443 type:complete len:293 (+) Transcript_10037:568-1446(+)